MLLVEYDILRVQAFSFVDSEQNRQKSQGI